MTVTPNSMPLSLTEKGLEDFLGLDFKEASADQIKSLMIYGILACNGGTLLTKDVFDVWNGLMLENGTVVSAVRTLRERYAKMGTPVPQRMKN